MYSNSIQNELKFSWLKVNFIQKVRTSLLHPCCGVNFAKLRHIFSRYCMNFKFMEFYFFSFRTKKCITVKLDVYWKLQIVSLYTCQLYQVFHSQSRHQRGDCCSGHLSAPQCQISTICKNSQRCIERDLLWLHGKQQQHQLSGTTLQPTRK